MGALIIFSALVGVFVIPFILIFHPYALEVSFSNALWIILSGIVWTLAVLPYLYAIQADDVSVATPIFQTIPIFVLVFGLVFLGESIALSQYFGMAFVILGSIFLSLNLSESKFRFKGRVFWLMLLSSFLFALNALVFKFIALEESFWTTALWESVGLSIASVLFILIPSYRGQFVGIFRRNAGSVLLLNAVNEILGIAAKLVANFATLLVPLALVYTVQGTQPVLVLIFGAVLSALFPRFIKEDLTRKNLFQRMTAVLTVVIGAYLLQ